MLETVTIKNVLMGLAYSAAGFCVFLILLNRVLLHFKDGLAKLAIILFYLVVLTLGAGVLGSYLDLTTWSIIPFLIILFISIGEIRRFLIRRSFAASAPTTVEGRPQSIFKPITTTDLVLTHYNIFCEDWNGDRFRVAQISDLHICDQLSLDYYNQSLKKVQDTKPDLIFYTGDFITSIKSADLIPSVLRTARGKFGEYAVLGNHDYWAGAQKVLASIRASGVKVLGAQSELISLEKAGSVNIIGYEGPWGDEEFQSPKAEPGSLSLCLTHTPDNIYKLSASPIDAVFSGHLHAGQIRLPYLGSFVAPSIYGRRFDHGHFKVNDTHLFVSAGVGSIPPLRIYCPPDVFIVDIRGSNKA